jgi:hypothetical protein
MLKLIRFTEQTSHNLPKSKSSFLRSFFHITLLLSTEIDRPVYSTGGPITLLFPPVFSYR